VGARLFAPASARLRLGKTFAVGVGREWLWNVPALNAAFCSLRFDERGEEKSQLKGTV
jgi:hypothetical protein